MEIVSPGSIEPGENDTSTASAPPGTDARRELERKWLMERLLDQDYVARLGGPMD